MPEFVNNIVFDDPIGDDDISLRNRECATPGSGNTDVSCEMEAVALTNTISRMVRFFRLIPDRGGH